MDVATGRTWTCYGWSRGAWHAREHVLKDYWQIFVDYLPLPRLAGQCTAEGNVLLLMDKTCGWGEEEKWVGSIFAACMWVYSKCVLYDGQETTQNFVKRRMVSIVESVGWVCEEVLEEHERASPLTISLKEEEEVLMDLDYELYCGTMGISLVCCFLKTKCGTGLSRRQSRQVPQGYKHGN